MPFAVSDRRARVTIVLLLVIVLQAVTLFVIAKAQGADTPYMAFKMVYLAIYPLAILAAVALAQLASWMLAPSGQRVEARIGWIIATLLLSSRCGPRSPRHARSPWLISICTQPANGCARTAARPASDYLVADAETAYWLHLAVLGNPRASERMIELDRYDPRGAAGPWITAEGRSYAIADLRLLPDEVRSRV